MKKLGLLVLFLLLTTISAQKFNITKGDLGFLKGQSEVNVQLNFNEVELMKDNITETEYLENRKKDILANDKKSEQDWIDWNNEWQKFKSEVYLEKFIVGANQNKSIQFGKDLSTKYTLIIDTKWVYPGWFGFAVQPAKLSAVLKFVETQNPSNVLLEINVDKLEGLGVKGEKNYYMEYGRIAVAYERCGKLLAKEIRVKLK